MKKDTMEQNKDYSVIFKCLDDVKRGTDFHYIEETMEQSNVISEEIEKLRTIVSDYERHSFSILTTV
jgi:uncharacterized protein YwgA